MQRELKFRIWNHTEGHWNGMRCKDVQSCGHLICLNGIYVIPESVSRNHTVQQFTGLLDKNGVEIAEGDILKCKGFDDWFDTVGFYYNVTVKYETVESGDSHIAGFAYIPMDREVIGNIFENSELLK